MTNLFFQCSKIVVIVSVVLILLTRFIATSRITNSDLLAYTVKNYGNTSLMLFDFSNATNTPIFSSDVPIAFSLSANDRLAYSSQEGGDGEIYLLDMQSIDQRPVNITQNPSAFEYPLEWSPDGRYLAYAATSDKKTMLYIWDGETVVDVTPVDVNDLFVEYHTIWSDDGKLAFTVWFNFDTDRKSEIYLWDGNATTSLSQNPIGEDRAPIWSSDGQIAYLSARDGHYNIYGWDGISYKDGLPSIKPLIDDPSGLIGYYSDPSWTSDRQLSFNSQTAADTHIQIYVWDGKTATNISQNPTMHNGSPEWGHDGRLAFATYWSSQQLLYVRDAENNTLLTTEGQFPPAWSPNGLLMFCNYGWKLSIWDGYEIIRLAQASEITAKWSNGNSVFCSSG